MVSMQLTKWGNRSMFTLTIIVLLIVSYKLADLTWFILYPPQYVSSSQNMRPGSDSGLSTGGKSDLALINKSVSIDKIVSWHLFGSIVEKKEIEKIKPVVTNAPVTKLKLELKGVFIAFDEAASSAIIAEQGQSGMLYQVGESIPGQSKLAAVYTDRVLLSRQGRLEALFFSKEKLGKIVRKEKVAMKPKPQKSRKNSKISKLLNAKSGKKPSEEQLLNALKLELGKDPMAVVRELGLKAVPDDEGAYQITAATSSVLMRMLGLRRGDYLRTVEGYTVASLLADKALLQQILAQATVQVEVQRGTRRFTTTVNLADNR